jgi:ankyrin repeat protein
LNVKHRAQDGRTPLHQVPFAIQDQGLPSLVELLIDAGADVHEQDAKGKTPLDLCIDQHNSARALLFIAHGAVDRGRVIWMHSAGISPIRAAAITGCTERVIALYDPEDPDNGLDELERLARDHRKTECLAAIQSMRAQMAIDTVTQIVDESPRHPGFSKT